MAQVAGPASPSLAAGAPAPAPGPPAPPIGRRLGRPCSETPPPRRGPDARLRAPAPSRAPPKFGGVGWRLSPPAPSAPFRVPPPAPPGAGPLGASRHGPSARGAALTAPGARHAQQDGPQDGRERRPRPPQGALQRVSGAERTGRGGRAARRGPCRRCRGRRGAGLLVAARERGAREARSVPGHPGGPDAPAPRGGPGSPPARRAVRTFAPGSQPGRGGHTLGGLHLAPDGASRGPTRGGRGFPSFPGGPAGVLSRGKLRDRGEGPGQSRPRLSAAGGGRLAGERSARFPRDRTFRTPIRPAAATQSASQRNGARGAPPRRQWRGARRAWPPDARWGWRGRRPERVVDGALGGLGTFAAFSFLGVGLQGSGSRTWLLSKPARPGGGGGSGTPTRCCGPAWRPGSSGTPRFRGLPEGHSRAGPHAQEGLRALDLLSVSGLGPLVKPLLPLRHPQSRGPGAVGRRAAGKKVLGRRWRAHLKGSGGCGSEPGRRQLRPGSPAPRGPEHLGLPLGKREQLSDL